MHAVDAHADVLMLAIANRQVQQLFVGTDGGQPSDVVQLSGDGDGHHGRVVDHEGTVKSVADLRG